MAFTFFFRDKHVLDLVIRHVVPTLAGRSHPRIWDAGAALGQEAYSLCMMLAEKMGYFSFNNLRIDATDLDSNDRFGRVIEAGIYPREEIERIPAEIFEKYFQPDGKPGHFQVIDSIRSRIAFHKHDLLSCREIGNGYSLVVCKNVMLHFQPAERVEVIRMFHRALAPGGYFATEQTQELPPELAPLFERVVSDAQLFRKVTPG